MRQFTLSEELDRYLAEYLISGERAFGLYRLSSFDDIKLEARTRESMIVEEFNNWYRRARKLRRKSEYWAVPEKFNTFHASYATISNITRPSLPAMLKIRDNFNDKTFHFEIYRFETILDTVDIRAETTIHTYYLFNRCTSPDINPERFKNTLDLILEKKQTLSEYDFA